MAMSQEVGVAGDRTICVLPRSPSSVFQLTHQGFVPARIRAFQFTHQGLVPTRFSAASSPVLAVGESGEGPSAQLREEDDSGGFLKLSQSKQWGLGVDGAPTNVKLKTFDMPTTEYDRRRAGLLEYEALKRELSLLTSAIAAFCSIYCGLVFSVQASVSYAIGSLGSLLYLQLLFRHADHVSEENVATVFMRKRPKKIGIRSNDLQDAFEKAFFGSGFALSSPRLVIPVSVYGLWTLVHRLGEPQLDLQITPLMFGFFAYKAALLVQAVRENKDLAMSFERENESGLGS